MKLKRLRIERLPGIRGSFEIGGLDPGLNVVLGPNASGKSSLCRAVRALLYEEPVEGAVLLEAELESAGDELRVARQGRDVAWTRDGTPCGAPDLPDPRLVHCFTVQIDDLLSEGETEEILLERVRRILAAGYDLAALRAQEPCAVRPHHGRNERKALQEAETRLGEERRRQREILAQERRLDEKRAERAEAARARDRVTHVDTALELLEARRAVGSLEEKIGSFPADMALLKGDESQRLRDLREMLSSHESDLDRAGRDAEEAHNLLERSGLDGDDPGEALLAEHEKVLDALRGAEARRERAEADLRAARGALETATRELGAAGPPGKLTIDPDTVRRVEEGLGGRRELESRRRVLEERLRLLAAADVEAPGLDALRTGRSELARWLVSPPPGRNSVRSNLGWILVVVVAALASIGVTAWRADPWWGLLAIPVVAAAIALFLRSAAPKDRRAEARERFSETGVAGPAQWEEDEVRRRLERLDGEVAEGERRRGDADRREALGREAESLRADLERNADDLRRLAERVGFDPTVLDASFDRWLRLVAEYDDARRAVSEHESGREMHAEEESELRGRLLGFLASHGESPEDPSAGAEIVGTRLRRLRERVRQRDGARERLRTAERARQRASEAIRATRDKVERLFVEAGLRPDQEAELMRRLERRDAWESVLRELDGQRAIARERDRRLGDRPDLRARVEADDETSLGVWRDEAQELAGRHEELSREITVIEERVRQAKSGHDLEDAAARRLACEEALESRLEEDLLAACARFLLDEVQRQHADASRPPVLRRAGEWFAEFTRHAFALEPPSGEDDVFLARDTSANESRTLAELSSGTRMQLLLALRLAFAAEAERGREPVPIFLDEALTVADPERYDRVVESLHEFARREDHQVFYLTAQPGDVRAWERGGVAPKLVLLHEVRRLATALADPARLELPPVEAPPSVEGLSDVEYGEALGVPGAGLWDPPESVHLFHLLRDDLPLLRRLLEPGIESVGRLRSLLATTAAGALLAESERTNLEWRLELVAPLLEACREGHGRPVDRDVLIAAGVSDVFLDRLADLAAELEGDGRALLDAIDARQDERVRHFHRTQRDKLERHFEDEGHLDPRSPLEPETLVLRGLGAVAPYVARGATGPDAVRDVARSLIAAIDPSRT